ncbi:hypothetical protein Q7574_18600 (plasmid) [Acinetobacter pittii]|uniref:hypothetical protein n=1 Tax=Acinetobacter pittii TaxID=48296 RepID=UPI00313EC064
MPLSQNVHGHILKLSQELSAGNGDNFGNGMLEKSGKNDFLITFYPILLAKDINLAQKKADMCLSRHFGVF